MNQQNNNQNEEKRSLPFFGIGKVLPFMKPYKKVLAIMIFCGLMGTCIDLLVPQFQRYALNHFISGSTLDTLVWFLMCYVGSLLVMGAVNYTSCKHAMATEVQVNRDLRNAAFNHLQTLSFSYFNQNSVGYIHARVMSDTSRIGSLVSWSLMDAVWHLSYLVGAVIVMFAVNAKLALMVTLILPLIIALFSIFQSKLIRVNREVRELNSKITSDFNEGITGAKTIKTLVIEDKMAHDFLEDTGAMRKKSVRVAHLRGLFSATLNMASSCALAIVLWRGGYIAASEVGTFSMFMSYAQGMMEPVRWIIDAISDLITTQVNIERFSRLIETQSDVVDSPEVIEKYGDAFNPCRENWEPIKGDIEFKDVDFKYPDGDEYVLENFNLKIPFGSNIAIVGETGAGKSTLVNLVCRFFEPTKGQVLIDGRDARERSQLWLHSAIGYVLQTPHLFSGTVRENLLYGNPNATDEQIKRALDLVSATEVVNRMEKGLDSDVGEGGDMLSTGEKQLISFARAILADPRILVLDEATASVDTLTEQKIQSAIETIIKGRTSLVIAHRLSTVKNADLILVVRDGKIIERGRHEELLKAKGHYYSLYTRQYEDEQTSSLFANA
ncbi:MAG: ABC transporter ATP-binding protein [Clostridia bacterium]|nr:ABC transporter ATP-binding protein [Clostridia bacterium]